MNEFEEIRDDKLRIGLLGLKRVVEANTKKMTKDEIMAFDFTFMNITNALTELQAIKDTKLKQLSGSQYNNIFIDEAVEPNEAVECLETLFDIICEREHTNSEHNFWLKNYNSIKQSLLKAEKLEKAWKIVNEKNVDVSLLNYFEDYTEYNVKIEEHNDKLKIYQGWWYRNKLAKEEFDLLKEMLE